MERIAAGLYKITYTLRGKGSMKGTYTLAVEAEYATSMVNTTGASIKTFIVKEAWKGWEHEAPKVLSGVALIGAFFALALVWRKKYQQE